MTATNSGGANLATLVANMLLGNVRITGWDADNVGDGVSGIVDLVFELEEDREYDEGLDLASVAPALKGSLENARLREELISAKAQVVEALGFANAYTVEHGVDVEVPAILEAWEKSRTAARGTGE